MYSGESLSQGRFDATSGLSWSDQDEFVIFFRTWWNNGDDLWRFILGDATNGIEWFFRNGSNAELTVRWQQSGETTQTATVANGTVYEMQTGVWTFALLHRDDQLYIVALDSGRASGTTAVREIGPLDLSAWGTHNLNDLAAEAYVGANSTPVSSGSGIFGGLWIVGLTGAQADTAYDSGNYGPIVDALLNPHNIPDLGTLLHSWDQVQNSGGTAKSPTRPTALVAGDLLADTTGGNDLTLSIESGKTVTQLPDYSPLTRWIENATRTGPLPQLQNCAPTLAKDPNGGFWEPQWSMDAAGQLLAWIGHLDSSLAPDRHPIPVIGKSQRYASSGNTVTHLNTFTRSGIADGKAEYHTCVAMIGAPNNSASQEHFCLYIAANHNDVSTDSGDTYVLWPCYLPIDLGATLTLSSVTVTPIDLYGELSESLPASPTSGEYLDTVATYGNLFTCSGVTDACFCATRRADQNNGEIIALQLPFPSSAKTVEAAKLVTTSGTKANTASPNGGGAIASNCILFTVGITYDTPVATQDPHGSQALLAGFVLHDADNFTDWQNIDGSNTSIPQTSEVLYNNGTRGSLFTLEVASNRDGVGTWDAIYPLCVADETGAVYIATMEIVDMAGSQTGSAADIHPRIVAYSADSGGDLGDPTETDLESMFDDNLGSGWHDSGNGFDRLDRSAGTNAFTAMTVQRHPTGAGATFVWCDADGETLQRTSLALGLVPYESRFGTNAFAITMRSPSGTPEWQGSILDLDGTGAYGVGHVMRAGSENIGALAGYGTLSRNTSQNVQHAGVVAMTTPALPSAANNPRSRDQRDRTHGWRPDRLGRRQ